VHDACVAVEDNAVARLIQALMRSASGITSTLCTNSRGRLLNLAARHESSHLVLSVAFQTVNWQCSSDVPSHAFRRNLTEPRLPADKRAAR